MALYTPLSAPRNLMAFILFHYEALSWDVRRPPKYRHHAGTGSSQPVQIVLYRQYMHSSSTASTAVPAVLEEHRSRP